MSKYRIKVLYGGYIPQVKRLFGWFDDGGVHTTREDAEKWIDREIELNSFKTRYIRYP